MYCEKHKIESPYTYKKQLEQNMCKKEQILNGYFEFWICNKKKD